MRCLNLLMKSKIDLGLNKHLQAIQDIIENGSSADRQLKIFQETNDLKLVKLYHEQTRIS